MRIRSNERVIINPTPPDNSEVFYNEFDRSLNFFFALEPSTNYTVEILRGMADPYGNTLAGQVISFTTAQAEPQIGLNVPDRVGLYDGSNDTQLFAVHRNVSRLDFELYSLDMNAFAALTGPQSFSAWENFQPEQSSRLMRSWSLEAESELNEYTFIRVPVVSDEGGSLPPGIYMLEMTTPEIVADTVLHAAPDDCCFG